MHKRDDVTSRRSAGYVALQPTSSFDLLWASYTPSFSISSELYARCELIDSRVSVLAPVGPSSGCRLDVSHCCASYNNKRVQTLSFFFSFLHSESHFVQLGL